MNINVGSMFGGMAVPSRLYLDHKLGAATWIVFAVLLLVGLGYMVYSIVIDYAGSGEQVTVIWLFVLLGLVLLIALGFEFVNGFYDIVNAVAIVIYINSLPLQVVVVWSNMFNF